MKVLAVLSGGLDSTVALAYAKDVGHQIVGAVSFNYGSKHNDREWQAAQEIAREYGVPIVRFDLPFINEHFKSDLLKTGGDIPEGHYADPSMKRTVVPFRNGIMLAIAAGYAESIEAKAILLGNHYGDHAIYPDCRKDFVMPMAEAIRAGTYAQVELFTPFTTWTKSQIVAMGAGLGVPMSKTYSCYNGREKHCGKCGTCVERIEAFRESGGVTDFTVYE